MQERIDWAAAEIVSTLSHKPMKDTLLHWDERPEFQSEAQETINALNLETVLRGAIREDDGNRL